MFAEIQVRPSLYGPSVMLLSLKGDFLILAKANSRRSYDVRRKAQRFFV